ncbi:MAG: osmotically inducible protein OsmC [Chlamydiales bacterium 38-26]|nr:MAG: osmotically inducible protein OsmC [Chlamydiales bacterium 38-26]
MVKMHIEYTGKLHCKAVHQPSGATIETDAPADIGGLARSFSPTDLLGCSLATCILTTLAIYAERKGWDLSRMQAEIEKSMTDTPSRRIGRLQVNLWIPHEFTDEDKKVLEKVANSCPVHKSLHPDVQVDLKFIWNELPR